MKITFYTVQTFPLRDAFKKTLRTGVMITFMFAATVASANPVKQYVAEQAAVTTETIATVSAKNILTKDIIPVEIFADSHSTLEFNTLQAYDRMVERCPQASELEPVMRFVTDGLGDIKAERVVMDCDMNNKVLNVSYRMHDNMLLSISKPLDTMDDGFVMFNVYHGRELLVSDSASIELLSQYIHNVENRIKELA